MNRVGVGIVTWRRPTFFAACAASVNAHLGWAHWLGAWHDGPDPQDDAYLPPDSYPLPLHSSERNEGVGAAKNHLIRLMLAADCDWVCLLEDDLAVTSPMAVLGFIEACRESGFEHLNFARHGHWDLLEVDGPITYYRNYSGGFSVTSRHAIEVAGLLDPELVNSYEHVCWTLEMAKYGFTSPWRRAADATGSENWLHEQPGAHDASVIARLPDTGRNAELGREHWKVAHPDTWPSELG